MNLCIVALVHALHVLATRVNKCDCPLRNAPSSFVYILTHTNPLLPKTNLERQGCKVMVKSSVALKLEWSKQA